MNKYNIFAFEYKLIAENVKNRKKAYCIRGLRIP